MAELTLSQEDIQELLSVLHVALYDAETTKRISRDLEEIDAIEERMVADLTEDQRLQLIYALKTCADALETSAAEI